MLIETNILTYLSIGSNQGNKVANLQKAVDRIFDRIGMIEIVSGLYKTPAWGFKGPDFLNACLVVKTRLTVEETLRKLLQIETGMGRGRGENGYTDRNIDLDIVFFGNESHNSENLIVPHPKMADRKFVLAPLAEIAPDFIHPINNATVSELLQQTNDQSEIEKVEQKLKIPKLDFSGFRYLSIEGNIGAGKTSLAKMISEDLSSNKAGPKAKLILEGFKDNPFLPKFYENPQRYAFPLEMTFLAERYQQLIDEIAQYDLFSDFVIADYEVSKSLTFAEITLQEDEFILYKKLFQLMHKNLIQPDLYVYLYQNTERLLENIKLRGRDYERNITADYLEKVNQGYLEFIKYQPNLKTEIIDVSELDFVKNHEDYLKVLRGITSEAGSS